MGFLEEISTKNHFIVIVKESFSAIYGCVLRSCPRLSQPNRAYIQVQKVIVLGVGAKGVPRGACSRLVQLYEIIVVPVPSDVQFELRVKLVDCVERILTNIVEFDVILHNVHSEIDFVQEVLDVFSRLALRVLSLVANHCLNVE